MKKCNYCGSQIDDYTIFCPNCGANQSDRHGGKRTFFDGNFNTQPKGNDRRSFGLALLSFVLPLVGVILWYCWRFTRPESAMSCAKGAAAGASFASPLLGLVLYILLKDNYHYSEIGRLAGKCALIGVIVNVVLSVVLNIILGSYPGLQDDIDSALPMLFNVLKK